MAAAHTMLACQARQIGGCAPTRRRTTIGCSRRLRAAFAHDGRDASLKAIARDAGVGIGTLYRRFPTREALMEATFRSETERICAMAPGLLADRSGADALRAWMERFVDYLETKHGMAEALHAILADGEPARLRTRELVIEAIAILMQAGVAEGALRSDVPPSDVMFAVGGVAMISQGEPGQRELVGRLLDLIVAGLGAASV
jgi:AcrR family transcriptional regulator